MIVTDKHYDLFADLILALRQSDWDTIQDLELGNEHIPAADAYEISLFAQMYVHQIEWPKTMVEIWLDEVVPFLTKMD